MNNFKKILNCIFVIHCLIKNFEKNNKHLLFYFNRINLNFYKLYLYNMKKIAIGFYGFMRIIPEKKIIDNFLNFFEDSNFDIYYNCPNVFDEFDETIIDFEKIKKNYNDLFDNLLIKNKYLKFIEYKPKDFILKAKECNYPFKNSSTNLFSHRILSTCKSINDIAIYINENDNEYDLIILTRFDIIELIVSIGDVNNTIFKNNIMLWRTTPYISFNDAEDRIIFCSKEAINKLVNLYDSTDLIIKKIEYMDIFYTETIIRIFYNLFEDIIKLPQSNVKIILSKNIGNKYSIEFHNNCHKLLEKYNIIYNVNE
jgi:hypothetical protein